MIPDSLKKIHLNELNLSECFKGSFAIWKKHLKTLATIYIMVSLPIKLVTYFGLTRLPSPIYTYFSISLLNVVYYIVAYLGTALIVEKFLLGESFSTNDILKKIGLLFLPALLPEILRSVIILLGFALLIVPGVIAFLFLHFTVPSVALRNTKGIAALKYSYEISKDHLGALFKKFAVAFGMAVLFFILLKIGLSLSQKFAINILFGLVFDVLVSFPILFLILIHLNLDYLKNGFPGEMPEEKPTDEKMFPASQIESLNPSSLQDIQQKAKASTQAENEKKKSSSLLEKSKFLKDLSNRFLKDKKQKMLEDLQALLDDDPNDMRIKSKVAETYYQLGRSHEAANTYLEIARHFEDENFFLKAVQAYKNILRIKPDLIEINLKLAKLYMKLDMPLEAANQYRIAITAYATASMKTKALEISEKLVKVDPSQENLTKLAEIYQMNGMKEEAMKQYETLAKQYRANKDYNKLLHIYEMILPHKPNNRAILKDICILHLRNKNPNRTLQIIDQYNMTTDSTFKELADKSHMMIEVLKRQ